MPVRILRMLPFGSKWRIRYDCGCSRTVTADQIRAEQLYIGKLVTDHACDTDEPALYA